MADGQSQAFAGNLFATAGQQVALAGRWVEDPKYGRQFKVDHVEVEMPSSAEGLAEFMANHPEIKGLALRRWTRLRHPHQEL